MPPKHHALETHFSRPKSLGYLSYRLARLFSRALDSRLAAHGVPIGQFRVLLILWEVEQSTQAELAHYLDIEQPTAAATISRMQRDGLITTSPDPADGRRLLIRMTERGRALRGPLTAEAQYINDLAIEGMTAAEAEQALDLLARLGDALAREVGF
ncbi:MAG TPA: MarR family winged helix-turn-helix transcriptional regulator [Kouleothrix sp.]|uniref:MarR family winged helix-turn-helix transcriptional regulator n=1 Tax=Kouleothrix sp. TaxID=2779161 RepID=UPI002C50C57C|nr:MarR family winged helix-turn-helix transcriptional regulator [Kouleothrix sp.]HRC75288.1 MarR family winged helix-turn-helix transcriptional regulator [Kouleothrix sp.]